MILLIRERYNCSRISLKTVFDCCEGSVVSRYQYNFRLAFAHDALSRQRNSCSMLQLCHVLLPRTHWTIVHAFAGNIFYSIWPIRFVYSISSFLHFPFPGIIPLDYSGLRCLVCRCEPIVFWWFHVFGMYCRVEDKLQHVSCTIQIDLHLSVFAASLTSLHQPHKARFHSPFLFHGNLWPRAVTNYYFKSIIQHGQCLIGCDVNRFFMWNER